MRPAVWWLLAVLSLVTVPASATMPPAEAVRRLQAVADSLPQVHLLSAGVSRAGREVPLLLVTARPEDPASQLRLMVIAGQHGYEPVPTRAVVRWAEAQTASAGLFQSVMVICLPQLNPDGAASGSRHNHGGADLNRDWRHRTQPETRLAEAVFTRWQPHVVVDLHDFVPEVRLGWPVPDHIEIASSGGQVAAASRAVFEPVVARYRDLHGSLQLRGFRAGGTDTRLAHRHFAVDRNAPAALVELGHNTPERMAGFLALLVERLASEAPGLKPRLDSLRGLRTWQPAERLPTPLPEVAFDQFETPAPPEPVSVPAPVPTLYVISAFGLTLLLRSKAQEREADI